MDKLDKRLSGGIAATAALENAPYVAGKWTYAAGAANFNSQSALGVSFRRTADNGRWSFTTGISSGVGGNDNNKPVVKIGVSGVIN